MATAIETYTGSDQENFFRLCILIVDYALKVLQHVLQEELKKKYPNIFDPNTGLLFGVLGYGNIKKKLYRLSVFNKQQKDQLYPSGNPSTSVTVGDLDITLTVFLLRNITKLVTGSKAWDNPSDSDKSTEAEIGRVKRYRNVDYAHIKGTAISLDVFREKFSGLKSSLLALSTVPPKYTADDYDKILFKRLDTIGPDLRKEYQDAMERLYNYDKDLKALTDTVNKNHEEVMNQLKTNEENEKGIHETLKRLCDKLPDTQEQRKIPGKRRIGDPQFSKHPAKRSRRRSSSLSDSDGSPVPSTSTSSQKPGRHHKQRAKSGSQSKSSTLSDKDSPAPSTSATGQRSGNSERRSRRGKRQIGDHNPQFSKHPAKRTKLKTRKPDTCYQAPIMRPTHKNLLVKMRQMLVENLQVKNIIRDMVATNIFSKDNAEKVKAKETENDQAFEFLRILPKCGPRAFETFVEVLRKHNKIELADKLTDKATAYSSKNQIANFYINYMSQIQRLPWDPDDTMHLDDVYVNLQWVQEERKPAGTSSVPIHSYTSILDTKHGKTPKRILVRGKAGIGKTTFTQKMATDWANATLGLGECDEVLLRYKHVLIINLRSIQPGQTLKEAIEMQITCSAENRKAVTDEVMQAIDSDSDRVLLVFDGYDEYDINTSEEITDIIYRRRYQDVCTVITTRPWKVEELMNRRITDGVYEITGLTEDNIAEYVAKFFSDKQTYDEDLALRSEPYRYFDNQDVLSSIGKGLVGYLLEKELMSLVKIPILLLFICLMWQEDQESDARSDSLPASYTLLYKKLIQLLLRRRYGFRTQDEMEQSACVQKLDEQTFISLGKLAYDGLVKPDGGLIFDEKDLQTIPDVNELYSLGLLSKCKVHSNLDVKHEVTFLHKTIQEFFAAKYLARKLDESDSNILDQLFENLDTTDKLYDMSFVLRFLCGLSMKATTEVLRRGEVLHNKDDEQDHSHKNMGYCVPDTCIDWYNDLLLEHWYAYCPQETVLPPELFSWLTELYIPESFEHSDPRFQQVLRDSMCSPQICSGLNAVIIDFEFGPDSCERHHKALCLLSECDIFRELVAVLWQGELHICDGCRSAFNHVLSKAPNLQTLKIGSDCGVALSSIPNSGKLLHLDVRGINDQDCQVILQMRHLKYICVCVEFPESIMPLPQLGGIPNTSHDLSRIHIRFTPLSAVGVQLFGRNLHHVPGLEHLTLVWVFMRIPECGPSRCTCPRGEDNTDYDRCQDVCEAVRELSQGVIHTTKLKYFSFSSNHLGHYHGITSPLIALIQSLSTVSQQTGMEIDMHNNGLGRVDRLSDLIEAIVSSYQHVSFWNLTYNDLEESLPQPDRSLNCKVQLKIGMLGGARVT